MSGRSEVLFEEDLVAIEQAVIKYPLGSNEIAKIATLCGKIKSFGYNVEPKLEMMLKEHGG